MSTHVLTQSMQSLFPALSILFLAFFPLGVSATEQYKTTSSLAELSLPPSLQSWRAWAMYQKEFRSCPLVAGTVGVDENHFLCSWPGKLSLHVDNQGVRLHQSWQLKTEGWVFLPGSLEHWPQEVRINGMPGATVNHGGPALRLPPGQYEISAHIPWKERPQTLSVPKAVGLIELRMEGKPVPHVQRKGDTLTLGRQVADSAETAELRVYRKLSDGIPAELETELHVHISGKAREVSLGPVLPEGFVPLLLNSPWPARLDAENRLQVQVQPGNAVLRLYARATTPLKELALYLPKDSNIPEDTEAPEDTHAPEGKGKQAEAKKAPPLWVAQEIWSYEAALALRSTAVSGAAQGNHVPALQVDPRQSGVPAAWHNLPAFALEDNALLSIEERARGLAADESNRLMLQRELWLNFAGDGYFARDNISGSMRHGWRFDLSAPYMLERANETLGSNASSALLITRGEKPDTTGVEWRETQVGLNAGIRIQKGVNGIVSRLPVNGWQQDFDSVHTKLRLPYGYRLLAAPGADHVSNSWLESWTVLYIFFAAFITLLAWRLLGFGGGIVSALYFLLAIQEAAAPTWTLALALGFSLLARALRGGRLGKLCKGLRWVMLASLILVSLFFIPQQLRSALYPQLESTGEESALSFPLLERLREERIALAGWSEDSSPYYASAEARPEISPMAAPPSVYPELSEEPLSQTRSSVRKADAPAPKKQKQNLNRYSQSTVIQTGRGEANWHHGHLYSLSWSGPVVANQEVSLFISPPWLTCIWRVLLCVFLGILIWRLMRGTTPEPKPVPKEKKESTPPAESEEGESGSTHIPPPAETGNTTTAAMACMLPCLLLALLWPGAATAQNTSNAAATASMPFPSEALLNEMQKRLSKAPGCAPNCAAFSSVKIRAAGDEIYVSLEANTAAAVALPLPVGEDNLTLLEARLNAATAGHLLHHNNGVWMALERGVHHIELRYAVNGASSSLYFPLRPMRAHFSGQGWSTESIDENRLINETLNLLRTTPLPSAEAVTEAGATQQFPPYVRVFRHLEFNLDWSSTTQVLRLAPEKGGLTLPVPLLEGEHVTTPGIKVQERHALASLGSSESMAQWEARLDKSETLTLTAPALTERAEVWKISVGPSWHIEWNGVPLTIPAKVGTEQVFQFNPLPGETLTLSLSEPKVAEGMVRAIDEVTLESKLGQRATTHTLHFRLRASQGGEHLFTLPDNSFEVLSVQRDNTPLSLRPREGKLTLPVSPGSQQFSIEMRQHVNIPFIFQSPEFSLGWPSANISLNTLLPKERWVLAVFGPPVGSVILYWGELLIALTLAVLLAKSRLGGSCFSGQFSEKRPLLRLHHWLLLTLGFSTYSWLALALVVAWLLAFSWRSQTQLTAFREARPWRFNFLQVGLVLLSFAALVTLISVIPSSLMGTPEMHIVEDRYFSDGTHVHRFADLSSEALPTLKVVSLPLWTYRLAMLCWALWLAVALMGWLRQGFSAWASGGWWQPLFRRKKQ
ncbi:MAG: hypothetical protein FWG75_01450 [Cystobacterineae bacterium]|nr:hypothetical protein [Cystobacterineae bacterium]